MLHASQLLPTVALHRYDDDGEPVYTMPERVMLALRWFDWASTSRVVEAMEDVDGRVVSQALNGLTSRGLIDKRRENGVTEFRLRLPVVEQPTPVTCRRCVKPPATGSVLCVGHGEWQRANKRARRRAA